MIQFGEFFLFLIEAAASRFSPTYGARALGVQFDLDSLFCPTYTARDLGITRAQVQRRTLPLHKGARRLSGAPMRQRSMGRYVVGGVWHRALRLFCVQFFSSSGEAVVG